MEDVDVTTICLHSDSIHLDAVDVDANHSNYLVDVVETSEWVVDALGLLSS